MEECRLLARIGNVADSLSIWAEHMPWAPAVLDGSDVVSYRRLETAVLKAAHKFSEIGLRPGDVAGVAIFQAPVALHLAAAFAFARIGVVYLMLSADEVASGEAVTLLRRHKARAVLTDMSLPADLGIPLISLDPDWLDPSAPMPRKVPHAAGGNMPWLLARSSGTTGKPKEFCLTHAMEIARHVAKPNESKLAIGERMMTLVDFGFIMGLRAALWCIFDGGVVVSSPKKATANEVFAAIDCYGVTSLLCTPTHLPTLWNGLSGDAPRLPLMRTLRIAGSALPETLFLASQASPFAKSAYHLWHQRSLGVSR